jgi:hypothetical protein
VVFVSERLRREIATYLGGIDTADPTRPLFATQKRDSLVTTLSTPLKKAY